MSKLLKIWLFASCGLVVGGDAAADRLGSDNYYRKLALAETAGDTIDPAGPLFYQKSSETTRIWASPPLFSYTLDTPTDFEEFDFLYPLLSYDRFGTEYRFHIFQVFNFSGGQTQSETNVHRFTLFPLYFQQRSKIKELNYTALLPIYGRLKNRLFRDEVRFVMMPIWVQSRKRDVVTDNYFYPIFHLRHGDGLKGWQVWPITGHEHKEVTIKTNAWGEGELAGGHDRRFVLWPFYVKAASGIGTTNPVMQSAILPLYSRLRSPNRDSTTFPWPIGYTKTVDREKKYTEIGAPWPLIVFANGEGKHTRRVWPFFSQSSNGTLESDFYLWPIYKFNGIKADPLERKRTRILFFLYSDIVEKNTETGQARVRKDLWPLFTARKDFNGDRTFQALSILEPLSPNNKSINRNYSPIWALWRTESVAATGARSESVLLNLYRREMAPDHIKLSLLFGLFQYQSSPEAKGWRVFYLPMGKGQKARDKG